MRVLTILPASRRRHHWTLAGACTRMAGEWGKVHLDEAAYKTTQAMYYPGFTFGGLIGEFGGMIALAVLLYLAPFGTMRFRWTAAALLLMVAAHGTYWADDPPHQQLLGQGRGEI
jgi:hypothetical protein